MVTEFLINAFTPADADDAALTTWIRTKTVRTRVCSKYATKPKPSYLIKGFHVRLLDCLVFYFLCMFFNESEHHPDESDDPNVDYDESLITTDLSHNNKRWFPNWVARTGLCE